MKRILLVCSAGMSTSMLIKKMLAAAQKENIDIEVEAHSISEAKAIGDQWDIILLGPQVKFQLKDMRQAFPNKPIDAIEMRSYGRMDGEAVLKQARELLGD